MLYVASLNSGSNGNCYYVGTASDAVLIDAGISCRETERRLQRLKLEVRRVRAIFVSHEHSDHIKGIRVLAKKYALPVYVSSRTAAAGRLDCRLMVDLIAHTPVCIGSLTITPFPKSHDAADPCSFLVSNGDVNVGVFTDIGLACSNVIKYFQLCDAAILESNYDEEMLSNGGYPYYLKQRIRSSKGHLSNDQALEIFQNYRSPRLRYLLLGHLSQHNNCPLKVEQLFKANCNGVQIVVASREVESAVFRVGQPACTQMAIPGW